MSICPIRGEAHVASDYVDGVVTPRWVRTDDEIHVANELLANPADRAQIEERYDVGEVCPHWPLARHARLRKDTTVADDRLAQAIDIVARHALARAAIEVIEDGWGFYDEVGEQDWHAIAERVEELAPFPDLATYEAAYGFLTERAEPA